MSFVVDDRLQIASHEGLAAGRTEKRKQLQQITKKNIISRRCIVGQMQVRYFARITDNCQFDSVVSRKQQIS